MSLFDRALGDIRVKKKNILDGNLNCIPFGFPRFGSHVDGIMRNMYYIVTANAKVGKTQITDWLFVIIPILTAIQTGINIRILYFTLEMTPLEKMYYLFSNMLYLKHGKRVDRKVLKSTREALSDELEMIIESERDYFEKFESMITFVDNVSDPDQILSIMDVSARAFGTFSMRDYGGGVKVEDNFTPYDPNMFFISVIDTADNISTGKKYMSKKLAIEYTSKGLKDWRNRFGMNPVLIQQQAASQENIEHIKYRKGKPTIDGLGETKLTARDANMILGLHAPARYNINEYHGYNVARMGDMFRTLEVLIDRDSGATGVWTPLYFDGMTNYFQELPLHDSADIVNFYR